MVSVSWKLLSHQSNYAAGEDKRAHGRLERELAHAEGTVGGSSLSGRASGGTG